MLSDGRTLDLHDAVSSPDVSRDVLPTPERQNSPIPQARPKNPSRNPNGEIPQGPAPQILPQL
jgi:hypothetical protein